MGQQPMDIIWAYSQTSFIRTAFLPYEMGSDCETYGLLKQFKYKDKGSFQKVCTDCAVYELKNVRINEVRLDSLT